MKRIFAPVMFICLGCCIKTTAQPGQWGAWQDASFPYSQLLSYRLKCGNFSKVTGDTEWYLEVKNNTRNAYRLDVGIYPIGSYRLKKTAQGSLKPQGQFHTLYTLPVSRNSYDLLKVVFDVYDKKTDTLVH